MQKDKGSSQDGRRDSGPPHKNFKKGFRRPRRGKHEYFIPGALGIKVLDGNIELALKKLKKEMKEAGVISEYRERRYYTKKSQVKRVKMEEAQRWQKKLDRDRARYDRNTVWDFRKIR
jgi:ribosomal protein S21